MAWTTPRTWVAGEIVTASIMNTHIRDNQRYLKGIDGAIQFESNITFPSTQTVDGVDVSVHQAGTAVAQHSGGAGDHTHQSAGAAGGKIDHGLALDGLSDDDHTQYQLKSLLTTQGDIVYATAASTWARLAKGTALQSLRMNAGATAPEWASITAVIATGSYTGDDGTNRAIAHGLGVTPKLVLVFRSASAALWGSIVNATLQNTRGDTASARTTVTAWDATNFYVSYEGTLGGLNANTAGYLFVAFG